MNTQTTCNDPKIFLSRVKELRQMLAQYGPDTLIVSARIVSAWDELFPVAQMLHEKDTLPKDDPGYPEQYNWSIARALGCITDGAAFARSLSGHAKGWLDEGLKILEHRLEALNEH